MWSRQTTLIYICVLEYVLPLSHAHEGSHIIQCGQKNRINVRTGQKKKNKVSNNLNISQG